jgi:aminocarboxymuconate-semialdehyde decarboxylase
MIIDSYPHMYPKTYLKAVQDAFPTPTVEFHLNNPRFYDVEARIRIMDKFRIDVQVINVAGGLPLHEPLSPDANSKGQFSKLARLANEETANVVNTNQERFVGTATLPLHDIGGSLDELDRCVRDLGMKGVCIWTSNIPISMDSRDLDPLYQKMSKYDLPILIHPSFGHYVKEPEEFALGITLGWPFETAMAMARLVFGGVFQRFPNIKFVTHHAGSMIPYFSGRIMNFYESVIDGSEASLDGLFYRRRLQKNPIEYFKLFHNDTAVSGFSPSLSVALAFFGPEHVMLGTDYPYGPKLGEGSLQYTLDSIERLGLEEKAKRAVLGENARKVFKLED